MQPGNAADFALSFQTAGENCHSPAEEKEYMGICYHSNPEFRVRFFLAGEGGGGESLAFKVRI